MFYQNQGTKAETDLWINVPYDQRFSGKRFTIYGKHVAKVVLKQLAD
jgi:hypothetical protein